MRTHDQAEATRLLASGGTLRRLALDMRVDLRSVALPQLEPLLPGVRLDAVQPRAASQLAKAAASATPPDHVDHATWAEVDRELYWKSLLAGAGSCGPVITEASRTAVTADGTLAGAAIVTLMQRSDWWRGGPWIAEVFIVPRFQGRSIGRHLLLHAMTACAASAHTVMGLTVSDGNPARRLYERLGFQAFRATWFVEGSSASPG